MFINFFIEKLIIQINTASSSMSYHQQSLPHNYLNRDRCYFNTQPASQPQPIRNFYPEESLNYAHTLSGPTHRSFSEVDLQLRTLHSEKNLTAPIQIIREEKHKRNTLPHLEMELQTHSNHHLHSPSRKSLINRKIHFTYHSPTNNPLPLLQSLASSSHHHYPSSRINVFQFSKKELRKNRNKLSSLQFSFSYIPKQKIKSDPEFPILNSKKSKSLIEEGRTSIILSNKLQESQSNLITESKMASTIATQSFYNQNRRSDLTSHQNFKSINISKNSYFAINQKPNLMDQIPKAKQLGETVILTHNDYSFGGIIDKGNSFENYIEKIDIKKGILHECEMRQWNNHVKCLIDNKDSQDLKQSIHEGPELRLERHKFDMLDGFGREIKESSMSIHL